MPELERPDGARIHYSERGEGPLVVFSLGFVTTPAVYDGLVTDLARDHRVVLWDVRGCGRSTGGGPFRISVDAQDLAALMNELGVSAKVFAAGHGVNVAAEAAVSAPERVSSLVAHGITTALLDDLSGVEGLGASRPVAEMLTQQLGRDPRGSLRALLTSLNPQLSDEELRARVDATAEYADFDASRERIEAWLEDTSALGELRELGGKVNVLWYDSDEWQRGTADGIAALLPDAHMRELEEGPLSRPDLSAELLRSLG